MSKTIVPIAEFAPAARVPIEVVQQQAAAFENLPVAAALLNSVLNYVFVLNPQRQIVFASRNLLPLTSEKEYQGLIGKRPGEVLGCIHAEDCVAGCGTSEWCSQCGALQAVLGGLAGRPTVRECRMTRVINCTLEALDLLVLATPFAYQGETFSVVSVADTSHEKRRRIFERIFFHDLINSAGGLEGLMRELKDDAPSEMKPMLDLAEQSLRDMLEQVLAQRELSSAERADLEITVTPLNSVELLREVVDLYARHEIASGKDLEVAGDAVKRVFQSDRSLLKRVLGNLVKNALEASGPGQKVVAGCRSVGPEVQFWVHNPGFMPREIQLQVFNRSFSTKGAARGLGTYSVRLLTERYLKGQVAFLSSRDEGTTFCVTLPARI